MSKFCSACSVVILLVSVSTSACSKIVADENVLQLQSMNVEIVEIFDTAPVTIAFIIKNSAGEDTTNTLTIDPGCEFYLNNELSYLGSDIITPGDMAKIEYVVNEGEKVAFKIYVVS